MTEYTRSLMILNNLGANHIATLMIGARNQKVPTEKNFHALQDLGLFTATATFQAREIGMTLHQMAGMNHRKLIRSQKSISFMNEIESISISRLCSFSLPHFAKN